MGGYVFNHRNGAVSRTGFKMTYAYHLKFEESQLSFGLSFIGYQYRVDKDQIDMLDPGDEVYLNLDQSVFIPEADLGIYYMAKSLWAGLSVDNLLESSLKFGGQGYEKLVMERTYYLTGGYDLEINRDLIFTPSAFIRFAENVKTQADVSASLFYNQAFWGSLTYRTGHALIVGAGVSVDRFVFGYAFDIGLNSLMKYSHGTHEFTFIVKLGDQTRRHRWLTRY